MNVYHFLSILPAWLDGTRQILFCIIRVLGTSAKSVIILTIGFNSIIGKMVCTPEAVIMQVSLIEFRCISPEITGIVTLGKVAYPISCLQY